MYGQCGRVSRNVTSISRQVIDDVGPEEGQSGAAAADLSNRIREAIRGTRIFANR